MRAGALIVLVFHGYCQLDITAVLPNHVIVPEKHIYGNSHIVYRHCMSSG